MTVGPMPSAATITVGQTVVLLDTVFLELAEAVANGRYGLWLGSGISRDRVDNLPHVLGRVLEHLQTHLDPADPMCPYRRAIDEILRLAMLSPDEQARVDLDEDMR